MKMIVFPEKGLFKVLVTYTASEILTPFFLINRDFTIDKLICDSIEMVPDVTSIGLTDYVEITEYGVK